MYRGRIPVRTGQRIVVVACTAVLAIQVAVIADRRAKRPSDFDIAREFGRRFLAGENLYQGGLHFPYLPAAAMVHAPLALVGPQVGFAARYFVALAALALTLSMLGRMLPLRFASSEERFAVAATAVALGLQYVLRDLGEAGPHLILLALVIGGVFLAGRGHDAAAAPLVGLAISVKTPLAFLLPFFAWKRRWALLLWTALATALWIVAPALWMGPTSWWTHHRTWARASLPFIASAAAGDASGPPVAVRAIEDWPNNQSLRAVLARNLPDRLLRADAAASLLTGVFVACVGWWMRRPLRAPGDRAWLVQSSAALILAAILSPIAWRQHLVFALPALYLVVARHRTAGGIGRSATAAMALYCVLALVLNREIVGRDLSYQLNGYGLHTWAMLLVLGVLMTSVPCPYPDEAPAGEK